MRFVLLPILSLVMAGALAQPEQSAVPYIPPEDSPFFVVRTDETARSTSRRDQKDKNLRESFPRNKGADRSAGQMFTGFFTEMFASVRLGKTKKTAGSNLEVDPKEFSLDDRREVTINFTVFNKSNRLLKLEFPTAQRIEIIVRDPSGNVIERWSDDRAFPDQAGVVMINPDERIEYKEKIATREMIPGTTYTIEASLANNPEFTQSTQVTPTGTRNLPPAPVPGESQQNAEGDTGNQPPSTTDN